MRKFLAERPLVLVVMIIVAAVMTIWAFDKWQRQTYYSCYANTPLGADACAARAGWMPH